MLTEHPMFTAVLLSPTPSITPHQHRAPWDRVPNVMPNRDAQSQFARVEFLYGQRKAPDFRGFLSSG
jgi:hypothetical protein